MVFFLAFLKLSKIAALRSIWYIRPFWCENIYVTFNDIQPIYNSCILQFVRSLRGVLDTTLCNNVCQLLATGRWFSPATPVSSTNKIDSHDITVILLKVALNTINLSLTQTNTVCAGKIIIYNMILHAVRLYNNSDMDYNLYVLNPQFVRKLIPVCLFSDIFQQCTVYGVNKYS